MPNDESLLCRAFVTLGICAYGNDCRFAHGEVDVPRVLARRESRKHDIKQQRKIRARERTGVCSLFVAGKECPFGENCKFAHVRGQRAVEIHERVSRRKQGPVTTTSATSSHDAEYIDELQEDLEVWISRQIKKCSLYSSYPGVFDTAVKIILRWQARYIEHPDIWKRIMKGRGHRLLKELNESAPVIDRVMKNIVSLTSTQVVTIFDICSGFGYLSMFLSEFLPPNKVSGIVLVDKMWERVSRLQTKTVEPETPPVSTCASSTADNESDILKDDNWSDNGHKNKISHHHISGEFASKWPVPVVPLRLDMKSRSSLRSLQRRIDTGDLQRWLGRQPQEKQADEEAVSNKVGYAEQCSDSVDDNMLIFLGIHLCGTLSLRAVDLFNANRLRTVLYVLKPCCLPNSTLISSEKILVIGRHTFHSKDVCAPGRWIAKSKQHHSTDSCNRSTGCSGYNGSKWTGQPRSHLAVKFDRWVEHLWRGMDCCNICTADRPAVDCGINDVQLREIDVLIEKYKSYIKCDLCTVGASNRESDDSNALCIESSALEDNILRQYQGTTSTCHLLSDNGSDSVWTPTILLSDSGESKDGGMWCKTVEHVQLQEHCYQNKYIWFEQLFESF